MIERGHDYNRVLAMDMLSFESLYESCERLQAYDRSEMVSMIMVASRGDEKGLNKWNEHNMPQSLKPKQPTNDMNKFIAKHSSGI